MQHARAGMQGLARGMPQLDLSKHSPCKHMQAPDALSQLTKAKDVARHRGSTTLVELWRKVGGEVGLLRTSKRLCPQRSHACEVLVGEPLRR